MCVIKTLKMRFLCIIKSNWTLTLTKEKYFMPTKSFFFAKRTKIKNKLVFHENDFNGWECKRWKTITRDLKGQTHIYIIKFIKSNMFIFVYFYLWMNHIFYNFIRNLIVLYLHLTSLYFYSICPAFDLLCYG